MSVDEIPLSGGRANAGGVVRIGDQVARPVHPQTPWVEDFLGHLRAQGADFVPEPLGRDDSGRQRLSWIPGRAPTSPYPDWAWSPDLLADLVARQRELHQLAAGYQPPSGAVWAVSGGAYFPDGSHGRRFCHNDLCLSNVIVDVGSWRVAGFVDFDYVAPVDPLFDIAVLARHWAPFGDPEGSDLDGIDRVGRFAMICDGHRLTRAERHRVIELGMAFLEQARANVRALAEAGNVGFQAMIKAGYDQTNRTTVAWLATNRAALTRG